MALLVRYCCCLKSLLWAVAYGHSSRLPLLEAPVMIAEKCKMFLSYSFLKKLPWSSAGALAEEQAAEEVFFLQGEEEEDSKRRAARLQRGMFMHPNLTLAAALGKPV